MGMLPFSELIKYKEFKKHFAKDVGKYLKYFGAPKNTFVVTIITALQNGILLKVIKNHKLDVWTEYENWRQEYGFVEIYCPYMKWLSIRINASDFILKNGGYWLDCGPIKGLPRYSVKYTVIENGTKSEYDAIVTPAHAEPIIAWMNSFVEN